ncbi:hypothetical protein F442_20224 [Phytophthora nicotianae P10297]|uniref:Uncharacterized protein n=1 Tax=Phytophthora nicotianae P10297 TaxID=1317064 RepID=W2Y808_PHYNI|nr:hypothetical protein F442_20224 [Phytophthora nicotianae P10297]
MPRSEKHDSDDAGNRASKRRRVGTDAASVRGDGCGDVMLFKEAWRALRGAGWTAKPPPRRSLDTRYKYVRPGGNPAGAEDVDYPPLYVPEEMELVTTRPLGFVTALSPREMEVLD